MTDEKEENYVKIETNMKWYNTDDIIYLILYQYLVGFLGKIKKADFDALPMMSKTEADAIGAIYDIDESDYVAREAPHPGAGEVGYPFYGRDENGELVLGEPMSIPKDAKAMTVPFDRETVFVDMTATLEHLIAAYDATDWDEKSKWWAKASQIVPYMRD